jgi:hypothetical protein
MGLGGGEVRHIAQKHFTRQKTTLFVKNASVAPIPCHFTQHRYTQLSPLTPLYENGGKGVLLRHTI